MSHYTINDHFPRTLNEALICLDEAEKDLAALRKRHQSLLQVARDGGSKDTTLEQAWDTIIAQRNALRAVCQRALDEDYCSYENCVKGGCLCNAIQIALNNGPSQCRSEEK